MEAVQRRAECVLSTSLPEPGFGKTDAVGIRELIAALERQRAILIDVATGTAIQTLNDEYSANRRTLAPALARLGLDDPFPWRDLWAWYGYYRDEYPTYQSRRDVIHTRADPVLAQLERRLTDGVSDWGAGQDTPGWSALEVRVEGLKAELEAATTQDDLQDVGRRAREIVIDVANLIFSDWMTPEGEDVPGGTDAKRRIDFALAEMLPGESRSALRSLIRSAYTLNQAVTHSGSITRVDAFAAAQATVLLVRVLHRVWEAWEPF